MIKLCNKLFFTCKFLVINKLRFLMAEKAFNYWVSSAEDFHPKALSEPDLNLSAHPDPIIQPKLKIPFLIEQTSFSPSGKS